MAHARTNDLVSRFLGKLNIGTYNYLFPFMSWTERVEHSAPHHLRSAWQPSQAERVHQQVLGTASPGGLESMTLVKGFFSQRVIPTTCSPMRP